MGIMTLLIKFHKIQRLMKKLMAKIERMNMAKNLKNRSPIM